MDKIPGKAQLTPKEQLILLRDLFERTGALHEAQALQLRSWPFCVMPKIDKAEAVLDVSEKLVQYDWTGPPAKPPSKTSFQNLWKWVRTLLGDSWKLCVKYNGAPIFESGPAPELNVKPTKKRKPAARKKRR